MRDRTTERLPLRAMALKRAGALTDETMRRTWHYKTGACIGLTVNRHAVRLHYTVTDWQGGKRDCSERVRIEWTPCNLGGERPWLVCPGCGERRAALYSGPPFACYRCHGLAFRSEGQPRAFAQYDRGQDIAHDMAGEFVPLGDPFPDRPYGMRRATYAAKRATWDRLTAAARAEYSAFAGLDDEAFKRECAANAARRDREWERSLQQDRRKAERTAQRVREYWRDKPKPLSAMS